MFLFILLQTETKRLVKKKSYIFIISVHCPTQCQVPTLLNSIFKFRTLTPTLDMSEKTSPGKKTNFMYAATE